MSLSNDPNGYDWHEPRCPSCDRFDADCSCTQPVDHMAEWPMRKPPPYPADDEAKT